MSRSAERATPILLSSCRSSPLRSRAPSSWRITRRLWRVSRARSSRSRMRPAVTGRSRMSSRKGKRRRTSSPSAAGGHGHDQRLGRAPGLEPGLEGLALGVEPGGIRDDEGARALVEALRDLGQGVDLLGGHPRRKVALHDLAELSPDEELCHRSLCVRVAQSTRGGHRDRAPPAMRECRRSCGRRDPRPGSSGLRPQVTPIVRTPAARPAATSALESPTMALSAASKPRLARSRRSPPGSGLRPPASSGPQTSAKRDKAPSPARRARLSPPGLLVSTASVRSARRSRVSRAPG